MRATSRLLGSHAAPFALLATALACGGPQAAHGGRPGAEQAVAAPAIEHVRLSHHPVLSLVARTGDPQGALAFATQQSGGSATSAALASVLAARLEAGGVLGVEARAHGLGIELAWLVQSAADVERFIPALRVALQREVVRGDPALARARLAGEALRALRFTGSAEAAAAACSGELGLPPGAAPLDLDSNAGLANLERARRAAFSRDGSALAVLGPKAVLHAAVSAASDADRWPSPSADPEPWPTGESVGVDRSAGARRLSVALRVPDADAAIGAGVALGTPGSPLLERLATLAPPWRLERATGVARQTGGCLRLDAMPEQGDPGPNAGEIGRVAALIEADALRAATEAPPGSLAESVLRPLDPRRAAALAAWGALPSSRLEAAVTRIISYQAQPFDKVSAPDVHRAVVEARSRLVRPSVELSWRLEAGQGELWMLLASPCGTAMEGSKDAGASALMLRAAAEVARDGGVRLEPWVTPDGIGLLAHAPRSHPAELPAEQARRVATTLGRALSSQLEGAKIGAARAQHLAELGGRSFPGWALTLEGLAPEHPSLLEPRGLWESASEVATEALERARRALLVGPLRLTVLANVEAAQATRAAAELETWLMPFRAELRGCPSVRVNPARRGQAQPQGGLGTTGEGAYVGALLAPSGLAGARAAEVSAFVLNRAGGWLERGLAGIGGATAQAHALGGSRRPALVVAIRATPERVNEAIARVRAVLEQFARGSVSAEEVAYAQSELARRELAERFDPRRRIVELWRGSLPPVLNVTELRAAQAELGAAAHWLVGAALPP